MQQLERLVKENEELKEEIAELRLLYETIVEHSSLVENELEEKSSMMSGLLQKMKKYLSPQLYQSLVGQEVGAEIKYKRRFLTIFFSDIVGFTEITDRADPELLSDLLNGYLNEMAQLALKHGGTIDKFIGDAVMVFFGDPEYVNDEKHARDCCNMALDMMAAVRKLNVEWKRRGIPKGLQIRIGIHSGYCTVGNFGSENRMDYTIIGSNVNIASRLEGVAESNTIAISEVTKNLLSSDFEVSPVEAVKVKGVHYPIEVYQLKSNTGTDSHESLSLLHKSDDETWHLKSIVIHSELNEVEKHEMMQALHQALEQLRKLS